MRTHIQPRARTLGIYCAAVMMLGFIAQPILAGPIVADSHTVILDHFNGATVGASHGTLDYEPGAPGLENAVNLGSSSYIQYELPSALETQGTIEMWLKPNTNNVSIMNFNWNDTDSYPWAGHVLHLRLDAGSELSIGGWAWDPANMYGLTSGAAVPVGQWSHIALSWGSGAMLYVNGVLTASSSQSWHPASPQWAYLNYWGDTSLGLVDELHISDIQRTDAEIAADASTVPEPSTWVLLISGLTIGAVGRAKIAKLACLSLYERR